MVPVLIAQLNREANASLLEPPGCALECIPLAWQMNSLACAALKL